MVFTWGINDFGQLGTGTTDYATEPQRVQGLDDVPVADVSAGGWHSLALSDLGGATCPVPPHQYMPLFGLVCFHYIPVKPQHQSTKIGSCLSHTAFLAVSCVGPSFFLHQSSSSRHVMQTVHSVVPKSIKEIATSEVLLESHQ